mgnify:FL=1
MATLGGRRTLTLAAMIFAVAMPYIDQTIVALAVPDLQRDLGLSATGTQWIVNAYLLSLSALFLLGGKLADIAGRRRMVVIGVVVFATASLLCGLTPEGDLAEAWIITFRVIQGAGAALMIPASFAIVVGAFDVSTRGRALAAFFGITGSLTALGPLAGGYLTEWTWRSIFWVNVPFAIAALALTAVAKPDDRRTPAPLDRIGALLAAAGMGLTVLGLQQSSAWGWSNPATIACIAAGAAVLAAFVRHERRPATPLVDMRMFRSRGFAAANGVLFLTMMVFLPVFFFASVYAQVALGEDASAAALYLVIFFGAFAAASQLGGTIYDHHGVRVAVLPGCLVSATGFALWAWSLDDFSLGDEWIYIIMAAAGCGLILGPANTDALNRVAADRLGQATGINQTMRNFGASVGLAILGTVLILQTRGNVESSLTAVGLPKERADSIATALSRSGGGSAHPSFDEAAGPAGERIFAAVQDDFADATRTVFYLMAAILVATCIVSAIWLPRDRVAARARKAVQIDDTGPEPSTDPPIGVR